MQSPLYAEVPPPLTHQPPLPYFMQQINFESVLLSVYGSDISGIVTDKYSDLSWNPAFVLSSPDSGIYLDFNYRQTAPSYYGYYSYSDQDRVYPKWYNSTQINTLQTDPLYNFASILKINSKISLGVINRFLFDYGPFRSSSDWSVYSAGREINAYDKSAYDELELKTVDVADNQQTLWGTQTEISLGYKLNPKFDLGLKVGHYTFRRQGDLYDSRYSGMPHSLVNEKNDEDLAIHGEHFEVGAGVIYHCNKNSDLGLYASIMHGRSTEIDFSLDSSDYWSERDTDARYYSSNNYHLNDTHSYSSEGISPQVTITFQKTFNPAISMRSFFSFRHVQNDITGSIRASDATHADRTYDSYDYNTKTYNFARDETVQGSEHVLNGTGKETKTNYKWLASLQFMRDKTWSAFAAFIIKKQTLRTELSENSSYSRDQSSQRYYYGPGTNGQFTSYLKNYRYNYNSRIWSVTLPVGVQARVISGFSLLAGTDLKFDLAETKESGDMLYRQKVDRRTENGKIVVEDIQINRPETYRTHQPKEFSKTSGIYIGAFYEHSSGIKVYIKTDEDITKKSSWTFGSEYDF
jgi:hypothetical protein